MPPRKRRPAAAGSTHVPDSGGRQKRQRVSLACDACRTAREKCDGARPECGTCNAQSRACSYTSNSKKRGVKTGYLRTVELSLAWLFDQAPEAEKALHKALTQNDGALADKLFVAKGPASDRLYRRWIKSRIHAGIENLISDDRQTQNVSFAQDSEDNESTGNDSREDSADEDVSLSSIPPAGGVDNDWTAATSANPISRVSQCAYPRLPGQWRRFVDIYFTYTHCWLPIVYKEDVLNTAILYTPDGLRASISSNSYEASCHAQLWAILAVGAFQDGSCTSPSSHTAPHNIYETARALIPGDDSSFGRPMTCALIIHALILIGKGNRVAAWLFIGRAMRILLSSDQVGAATEPVDSRHLAKSPIMAACYFLDTLLSTCIQRPSHLTGNFDRYRQSIMLFIGSESTDPWNPMPGFGSAAQRRSVSGYPFLTLYQLLEFSVMAGAKIQADTSPHSAGWRITTDDLLRSLHPQLQFCSSLNLGSSVPIIPSALLLQIAFLASSIRISGSRASLLSTLLEIIEQSIEHFGACGVPPVVACFMESVEQKINFEDMRPSERNKWSWLQKKLMSTWQADQYSDTASSYGYAGQAQQQMISPATQSFTPQQASRNYAPSSGTGMLEEHSQVGRLATDGHASYLEPYATRDYSGKPTSMDMSPALPTPGRPAQDSPNMGRQRMPQFPAATNNLPMDYDAIFDELGSIEYGDTVEMDPQFMVNLGFAPGCNVADMFQGDFGN